MVHTGITIIYISSLNIFPLHMIAAARAHTTTAQLVFACAIRDLREFYVFIVVQSLFERDLLYMYMYQANQTHCARFAVPARSSLYIDIQHLESTASVRACCVRGEGKLEKPDARQDRQSGDARYMQFIYARNNVLCVYKK